MALKAIYDTKDEIPEAHIELFSERGGKWELTGVEGVKTQADVDRLSTSLTNERTEHKKTKDKLAGWAAFGDKPDEVRARLDRVEELELLVDGKGDQTKVDQLVEARLKQRIAPVERERDELKTKVNDLTTLISGFENEKKTNTIHGEIRKAAKKVGLLDGAIEDAILHGERVLELDATGKVVTKDGVGVTPGLAPDVWLGDLKQTRTHWWGETVGGGGKGGGGGGKGPNPWSADGWNMTQQGAYIKEHGRAKADQMAKLAGTTVGGQRPAAKK
jgi:hypothetical protein